jgi:hypothetical protein
MALHTVSMGTFNNDTVKVFYTYDDVTNRIISITLENPGQPGLLSAVVKSLDGVTTIYSGSKEFDDAPTTVTTNIPMTHVVGTSPKTGVPFDFWTAPFNVTLQWKSA